MRRINYKAGKLLRIDAKLDGKRIMKLKLHGDFFIHPEEGIEKIEKALLGTEIGTNAQTKELLKATENLRFVGITTQDILQALDKFIKVR